MWVLAFVAGSWALLATHSVRESRPAGRPGFSVRRARWKLVSGLAGREARWEETQPGDEVASSPGARGTRVPKRLPGDGRAVEKSPAAINSSGSVGVKIWENASLFGDPGRSWPGFQGEGGAELLPGLGAPPAGGIERGPRRLGAQQAGFCQLGCCSLPPEVWVMQAKLINPTQKPVESRGTPGLGKIGKNKIFRHILPTSGKVGTLEAGTGHGMMAVHKPGSGLD